MNYFAHACRFLDRSPIYLAGLAVPDWLSACDRKCRLRDKHVRVHLDDAELKPLAEGILQHIADDAAFHSSRAFLELNAQMTRKFRTLLGADDRYRPGFLGHVSVELILDGLLIEANPPGIDLYFEKLAEVHASTVETKVNRMAKRPTEKLAEFIDIFRAVQFLRDYDTPENTVARLNGVLRRVGLSPMPDEAASVIATGRELVAGRLHELLPDSLADQ